MLGEHEEQRWRKVAAGGVWLWEQLVTRGERRGNSLTRGALSVGKHAQIMAVLASALTLISTDLPSTSRGQRDEG